MSNFYNKYITYKNLYLNLQRNKVSKENINFSDKNKQFGGKKNIIIHISGPSGSGKTTLGNKLKDRFGDKIIVKDIDDLRQEFIKQFYGNKKWTIIDKDAYQKYIDDFVNRQTKPIIFVGLNNMFWWHKNHYYNMHPTYKYYIRIDDKIILKQKCLRLFDDLKDDKVAMDDLVNNNGTFIKMVKQGIERECSMKNNLWEINKWNKDYKKQGYKFMTRENIFNKVSNLIENRL